MKRVLMPGFACFLPLVIGAGLLVTAPQARGEERISSKTRKSTKQIVRAQNAEPAKSGKSAKLTDEEIFDLDLKPASNQIVGSEAAPCVSPVAPNCTNAIGNPMLPATPDPLLYPNSSNSATSPSPMSTSPNASTPETPNYAQPQAAASPALNSEGFGTASTGAPFLGDFFGGAIAGASTINGILGQCTLDPNDSTNTHCLVLESLGGVPHQFQTDGRDVFLDTATNTVQFVDVTPGVNQQGLQLISHGTTTESVLFNPPNVVGNPNPRRRTSLRHCTPIDSRWYQPRRNNRSHEVRRRFEPHSTRSRLLQLQLLRQCEDYLERSRHQSLYARI